MPKLNKIWWLIQRRLSGSERLDEKKFHITAGSP
jgi:hypothetical protein